MITRDDFSEATCLIHCEDNCVLNNEDEAIDKCYELAKQMAKDFFEWVNGDKNDLDPQFFTTDHMLELYIKSNK
jgi:hypothetical protein